ncbi:MAG: UbiA family prenyltransferase [Spirochaetales bacterium]|nr:UbiA family prenyltransferase [Spirochaetales bacterium]
MAFKRLRLYGELVMFSHTLFSLPFALAAMLISAGGFPGWHKTIWIILAFTGGRNAANALNRVIDHDIDARNPRTAGRHLPSGRLRRRDALLIAAAGTVLLIVSAFMLNLLCVLLLPFAVAAFVVYSYTKRFTWLCHVILGAACAAASFGAWIAVTGRIELSTFVIAAANAAWVAGFDVIYAIQDIDFDRAEGLYSIPARFGEKLSRLAAAGMHAASVFFLTATGYLNGLGVYFYAGVGIIAVLFIIEHLLVIPERVGRNSRLINFAAYNMNQIIGITLISFTVLDFLL